MGVSEAIAVGLHAAVGPSLYFWVTGCRSQGQKFGNF